MASKQTKNNELSLPEGNIPTDNIIDEEDALGYRLSLFDDSVENHFCMMDKLYDVCGASASVSCKEDEFKHLSNSVTFLREWRHFSYRPRKLRFSLETNSSPSAAVDEITIPQFASAEVPKSEFSTNEAMSAPSRNDYIFNVGGAVWALDWRPRQDVGPDVIKTCEFIAISAHPPDSAYHKLGASLSGRGMVQIWCLLNSKDSNEDVLMLTSKCRSKVKKDVREKKDDSQPKRPRGRPRKHPLNTTSSQPDCKEQCDKTLAIEYSQNTLDLTLLTSKPGSELEKDAEKKKKDSESKRPRGRPKKNPVSTASCQPDREGQCDKALTIDHPQSPLNISLQTCKPESELKKDAGEKMDDCQQKRYRIRPKRNTVNRESSQPDCGEQCDRVFTIEYPQKNPSNVTMLISKPGSELEKDVGEKKDDPQPKRPRGRQKKNPVSTTSSHPDCEEQSVGAFAVGIPQSPSNGTILTSKPGNNLEKDVGKKKGDPKPKRSRGRTKKSSVNTTSSHPDCEEQGVGAFAIEYQQNLLDVPVPTEMNDKSAKVDPVKRLKGQTRKKPATPDCDSQNHDDSSIPVVSHLPKVVFCIGHDGKVAWDVKWRPCADSYSECRLGYVAAVLGNGSLEVWEIPSPKLMKLIYFFQHQEGTGTDPRFVKLKPVFRCGMLKCGDRQSMPLTVEWSTSSPHNLILAGCHDGMVALWKFSASESSIDTKPLLFFSADTVPIRALSWAPCESDTESANVIVTAGHEGMKFWDLRDPFHPLWDISAQRFIYSIDWLPDPRCVLTSYDDGTLRILSISKAANDAPVTGKAYSGTQQQGLHSYYCSSFAIWSVHVSRHTGLVAYCGADGTVRYFQLTHKAVDKDPARNRAPHFLCGSLSEEDGKITVNIASANVPCPMKRSINEWGNTPKSLRGFVNSSNQARRTKESSAAPKKQKLDDDQAVVVCDDDEPGSDDWDQPLASLMKNTKASKMKLVRNKNDQGTSTPEGEEIGSGKKDQDGEGLAEFEDMPSKLVAMHRVRWNMNKGSLRWLCYGGASGIVRCQTIIPPVFDKKALKAWRS